MTLIDASGEHSPCKVKIINAEVSHLETEINDFAKDKVVYDIKVTSCSDSSCWQRCIATIIYLDALPGSI